MFILVSCQWTWLQNCDETKPAEILSEFLLIFQHHQKIFLKLVPSHNDISWENSIYFHGYCTWSPMEWVVFILVLCQWTLLQNLMEASAGPILGYFCQMISPTMTWKCQGVNVYWKSFQGLIFNLFFFPLVNQATANSKLNKNVSNLFDSICEFFFFQNVIKTNG